VDEAAAAGPAVVVTAMAISLACRLA
jgi:hypothetical protein